MRRKSGPANWRTSGLARNIPSANSLIANRQWLRRSRPGFSLVELSVAMVIFALLTVIVLANLNRGRQANDLRQSAVQLAQDLRDMQGRALAGQTIAGNVPKGYGIRFSDNAPNTSYRLFADVDGCLRYNSILESDDELGVRNFPKDVRISEIATDQGNLPPTMEIAFTPPQSIPYLNAVCSGTCSIGSGCAGTLTSGSTSPPYDTTVTITLLHDRINLMKTVVVNRLSGQVSVQ